MSNTHQKHDVTISSDQFELYVRLNENNNPQFIIYDDVALDEEFDKAVYAKEFVVEFLVKEPNDAGGPIGEEAEYLNKVEDMLVHELESGNVRCRYMGRITQEGKRWSVFEVADENGFVEVIKKVLDVCTDYSTELYTAEPFQIFNTVMKPSSYEYESILNRRVIAHLQRAGSNMDKEHAIEFCFSGEQENLEKLRMKLEEEGLSGVLAEGKTEILVMTKVMILDEVTLTDLTYRFRYELAPQYQVKYDGWAAGVIG